MIFVKLKQKLFYYTLLFSNYKIRSFIKDTNSIQYLPLSNIEQINWEKRKRIVRHAYENVVFYRKKFDEAGFHPDQLRSFDDFERIPILTRDEIRENLNDLVARGVDFSSLTKSGTGGSTGKPLMVFKHKEEIPLLVALKMRMLKWWKIYPISNHATAFRIVSNEDNNQSESKSLIKNNFIIARIKQLKLKIQRDVESVVHLDASLMNRELAYEFFLKTERNHAKYLVGYVGAINELANYIKEKKHKANFQAIWTTAAPLSKSVRENIEQSFGCPVYDQYGTIEVYYLAAECSEKNGLHFFYDTRHVEFIDDNGRKTNPNVNGNVILTDLENYIFPIIRYKNGDIGSWKVGTCSCGVNLPLINSIQGRISDRIFLKDGSTVSGEYLTTIFDDYANDINEFQIVQSSYDLLEIKLIMPDIARFDYISKIVGEKLKQVTKNTISIEFSLVKEIPHDKGKIRYIINNLGNNWVDEVV